MITNTIKYGGTIQIGDFIAVAKPNYFDFGWYIGNGKTNSIQYISPHNVMWYQDINNRNANKKVFTLDSVRKGFVKINRKNYILKISNPEELFTGDDLKNYLNAKEILIKLNFLKDEIRK